MSQNSHKLSQFWQELKRRNVGRVITVYAASAFVILELVDIITEPFGLPDWTLKLVVVILAVGLIVAIILSWIYDVHPERGIVKTEPAYKVKAEDVLQSSNNWKIASYISFVVIVALIVLNIIPRTGKKNILEKSIAVLPFENMSSDEEYSHIGGAFTDEIIMELQKIKAFDRVLSRTSTMQYGENRPTIPEIAEKLNVNYIIEGSIQRYKEEVSIIVQVIRAKNEDHILGMEYDRKWEDIFSIQDEIAFDVANELRIVMTPEEKQRIKRIPTDNFEAYNEYLLGKYFYNQHVLESFKEGIEHLNRAIHLDSTFALAYVYLAHTYQFMVRYNWIESDRVYQQVKKAILKSIELDETLGEAYAALALFKIVFDWDLYGPEEEFQKAIKLNPNSSEIYSLYAQYLRWMGRFEEGLIISQRAIDLDPVSPMANLWPGAIYFYAGRYDESINHIKQTLILDSSFVYANSHLAYAYTMKGSYADAIYYADRAMANPVFKETSAAATVAWVYAKSGEIAKAKEILTHIQGTSASEFYEAVIYQGLGENEMAIDLLYKAYEDRTGSMIYLYAFSKSFFKELNEYPRFINLLKEIGFKVNSL